MKDCRSVKEGTHFAVRTDHTKMYIAPEEILIIFSHELEDKIKDLELFEKYKEGLLGALITNLRSSQKKR